LIAGIPAVFLSTKVFGAVPAQEEVPRVEELVGSLAHALAALDGGTWAFSIEHDFVLLKRAV